MLLEDLYGNSGANMNQRHLRQSFLGENSDSVIEDACVAIIGLCGGGSHIAQQLAHIGINNFKLYDHDNAEDHNINRMVGLSHEAAKNQEPKTKVIAEMIKRINPNANITIVTKRWQEYPDYLKACTAIFGCIDSYLARDELERYARRYLVPYIDIGMDVHGDPDNYYLSGQVILSLPDYACMRCMGFITESRLATEANLYGKAGGRPQVIWPNGTLASIAIGKFMSILTPWNKNLEASLYTEYDGNRFLVMPSNKLKVINQDLCLHYGGKNGIGDYNF